MENSSEFYYRKLEKDDKPGSVLASYYCSIYDIEVTRSEIMFCNKLVKVFGRFAVFFAIQDAAGSQRTRMEDPYPYLYEICRRRFEQSHQDFSLQSRESLSKYIADINEDIENLKNKKLKIPSSEGLK